MTTRRTLLRGMALAAGMLLNGLAVARPSSNSDRTKVRAERFLREQMQNKRIPGMQVAVVRHGNVVLSFAGGVANVEHGAPVRARTLFPINSITKAFTGVAIMQLVQTGQLALDASIGRYVDDLPDSWRHILLRQLLSHTSGLPDIYGEDGLIGGGGEAEAWAAVRALPIAAPPGARAAYNQTNYMLLGRIIERTSQMPFMRFVTERQFARAGMPLARFGDTFDVIAGSAQPYSYKRRVRGKGEVETGALNHWIDDIPTILRPAAGIYTTAEEIAAWIGALQGGVLLDALRLKSLWAPQRLNDNTVGPWTLGWLQMSDAGPRALGGIGGGRSAFIIYPDHAIGAVVLTNLAGAEPQAFLAGLAQLYVPALGR